MLFGHLFTWHQHLRSLKRGSKCKFLKTIQLLYLCKLWKHEFVKSVTSCTHIICSVYRYMYRRFFTSDIANYWPEMCNTVLCKKKMLCVRANTELRALSLDRVGVVQVREELLSSEPSPWTAHQIRITVNLFIICRCELVNYYNCCCANVALDKVAKELIFSVWIFYMFCL